MKTDRLEIRTPEGVVFPLPLAGPVSRFLAWAIDISCISVVASAAGAVLGILGWTPDLRKAVLIVTYFAVSIGYGIGAEWLWRGQTIGKRVLRLRVVDEQGLRLRFPQILVRNLLRSVDMLPAFYLVGGAAMYASRRAQRLGDFAASTVVVRATPPPEPDLEQIRGGKYNSLREHQVLCARLRQRVTTEEAGIALQAILRRDLFDDAARVALFRDLASRFRSLVEFPPEAVEGIADEQHVRNVVDVLFTRRGTGGRRPAGDPERGASAGSISAAGEAASAGAPPLPRTPDAPETPTGAGA